METTDIIEQIGLDKFDTGLSHYRLILPSQIKMMRQLLERQGQLQPVIVRSASSDYQLIDGFKRYYAAERLEIPVLSAMVLEVSESKAKAMILAYNKGSQCLIDYEEGLIVYSLHQDHKMSQKEISELTGYSPSWVCRRISLIERLDDNVQSQLRLGQLNAAHAREIVKLPRGNQQEVARVIIENNLSSRHSGWLIGKYLSAQNQEQKEYLLGHPMEAIERALTNTDIYDNRLSKHGNNLQKTIDVLIHQQNIFIGQYGDPKTKSLSEQEKNIIRPSVRRVFEKARTVINIIENKE